MRTYWEGAKISIFTRLKRGRKIGFLSDSVFFFLFLFAFFHSGNKVLIQKSFLNDTLLKEVGFSLPPYLFICSPNQRHSKRGGGSVMSYENR